MGPWRGRVCEPQGCERSSELLEHGSSVYVVAMACLCSCVAILCALRVLLGLLALKCSSFDVDDGSR